MINKYSNVPLYSQLKDLILEKIKKGEYAENTKIPSEQELCEMYDISRPTVRQAISELTSSGYLHKEKGKGTYVSKSKESIDIKNYTGFTPSILDSAVPGEYDVLSMDVILAANNENLQKVFNLTSMSQTEFAQICYMTFYGENIASINTSYIPLSVFPNIMEDVKAKKPSYDILRAKYPYIPSKAKSTLEIGFCDLSDSSYLQIQPGQPVIHINNILYSKSGQVVEYIVCKYRADKVRLQFENNK